MSKAIVLRRGAFRSLCGVLAIAALAACGSFPPAPAQVASPDYNYLIGPLDSLNIIVWRNPELSMTVPVRPDGKVSVPLVEDLPALGKHPTQLARDIEKAMSRFIRDPGVNVWSKTGRRRFVA